MASLCVKLWIIYEYKRSMAVFWHSKIHVYISVLLLSSNTLTYKSFDHSLYGHIYTLVWVHLGQEMFYRTSCDNGIM